MARDVTDDTYYVTKGGKIPVKWTAPEVNMHNYIRMYGRNADVEQLRHLF